MSIFVVEFQKWIRIYRRLEIFNKFKEYNRIEMEKNVKDINKKKNIKKENIITLYLFSILKENIVNKMYEWHK